jgi:hypothetical protein
MLTTALWTIGSISIWLAFSVLNYVTLKLTGVYDDELFAFRCHVLLFGPIATATMLLISMAELANTAILKIGDAVITAIQQSRSRR